MRLAKRESTPGASTHQVERVEGKKSKGMGKEGIASRVHYAVEVNDDDATRARLARLV